MKILLNNRYVDVKKALLPALDRGLLYGQGVFETMRAKNGQVLFYRDHFERLKKGAAFVGLRFDLTLGGIKKIIKRLMEINSLDNAYIRVTLTGGDNGPRGTIVSSMFPKSQTLMVHTHRYNPLPESCYKNGVRLALSPFRRNRASAISHFKTTSYLENMLAKREALAKHCFDALFLDNEGFVAECATSNIFWVKRNVLFTPALKCPVLPGITRKTVIGLAKRVGIKVKELDRPGFKDFQNADESFVTNSIVGVLPIKKIGKITSSLMDLYERKIKC